MSQLATNDKPRLPDETSASLNSTETASNGSSKTGVSRKRRASQTPEDVDRNLNLSAADEDSSEVQELAEMEIDDFGSGIIQYMRDWKQQILSLKMTHLDIVRKYVVWSKTPLSLFQEINLQSLFVYMDAYHPGVACNSEPSPPTSTAVEAPNRGPINVASLTENSLNGELPPAAREPPRALQALEALNPRPLRIIVPGANLSLHTQQEAAPPRLGTAEPDLNWLNDRSIVCALLDQNFVAVGGSNPLAQNLNTSNHTAPVDPSNRGFQPLNTSNHTIPVDASNRSFQLLNTSNHTIPVDASNRSFQLLNTSNHTIPLGNSNVDLQQFDRSNQSISLGEYVASRLGVPAWTTLPLVPSISAPNPV